MADKKKPEKRAEPPSERLVIEGDWRHAMKKAIGKKLPENGIPGRATKKRSRKRKP
jgi:hypothetical protein